MSPFGPLRHSGLDDGDTAARCSGSSIVESRSSGDGGVGGASRRWQHPSLDRISVSLSVVMAAQVNLIVRAVIPTYLL